MGPGNHSTRARRGPLGRALAGAGAACALALGLAPSPALSQSNQAVEARTEIQDSLQLAKIHDLDFGQIAVRGAGDVTMNPANPSDCTPTANLVIADGCHPAGFDGRAQTGRQIRLRLPPRRRVLLTGPGRNLRLVQMTIAQVHGLQFVSRAGRNYRFNVNSSDGSFGFRVGGRLRVRNNQAPGAYSNTFDIVLDYN